MSQNQPQSLSDVIRQSATPDDLLNEKQAAEVLQVKPGTLAVWRSTGRYSIPFVKIGCLVRYRRSDLTAWLESRYHANGATA